MSYLERKKNKLIAQTEYVSQSIEDWQTIRDYISNRVEDIVLNKRQRDKLQRYDYMYAQLMSRKYTEAEVISQVEQRFNVKRSTAIQDLQSTREIYTVTIGINKRFEIKVQIEGLKIQLAKAAALGKLAEYSMLSRCLSDYYKQLPDEEVNQAELFTPHQNIMQFDPDKLGFPKIDAAEWQKLKTDLKTKHNFDFDDEIIEEAIIVDED